MMAGNNVGEDVGNDVHDGDNGGNDAGDNTGKGDEGGGVLLVEDTAVAAAAAAALYCRGRLLFIVKIFLCGIFMMCGGNLQGHTSPHTLVTLEVCTYPGVLANIFCLNVDTYKVGKYISSN
jgi:hypothetical protein